MSFILDTATLKGFFSLFFLMQQTMERTRLLDKKKREGKALIALLADALLLLMHTLCITCGPRLDDGNH